MRVSWYKDEEEINPCEKHELRDQGCVHKLIIHDLSADDYGNYVVVIGSKRMTGFNLREGVYVHLILEMRNHFLKVSLLTVDIYGNKCSGFVLL